jgi:peptidoglycan/xylan/chitin deacetylase (PgdA/CDA1 family)
VALTFDAEHADRPHEFRTTERLVELLAATGTRATFFLQGRWVESVPSLARSIADAGNVIGNHGFYHARMSQLTEAGFRDDVARATEAIATATGVDPLPWFRCPFGDGASKAWVIRALAEDGYRHVGWHIDTQDWDDGVTADAVQQRVLSGVDEVGDGAVVLLHGWPTPTPVGVERVLEAANRRGITFVGIDELGVEPVETVPW